ncbi:hypothetical protein Taro_040263 [Colocasia esculenta]|uniref:DUF7653 domain-containing protein n=1 Tax=Colocasia esculenta TaxID=4460 RepID=A0A843WIL7_COLES|nr:hypothetical protein [Colocasia esculenta]
MRRFFSFRSSSASSGGKENPGPPTDVNVYWETPGENAPRDTAGAGGSGKSRSSRASGSPHLRRSLSFSSPGSSGFEGKCNFAGDVGAYLSDDANLPGQVAEGITQTPQKFPKSKRCSQGNAQKTHAFEKVDSPKSSKGHPSSMGNSPCSSPVPLRCRSSRVAQSLNTNNILDLYIDGEQHERRPRKNLQHSITEDDGCLVDKRTLPGFGRPPRAQYTAPSSPNYSKESLRSHSFREDKGINHSFSSWDWPGDHFRVISPRKYTRKVIRRQSCGLHGKDMTKVLDSESQTTTTVDDIYEDSLNDVVQKCALSDLIPADDNLSTYCTEEAPNFHEQNHFLRDGPVYIRHARAPCLSQQDEDVLEELARKLNEVEEKIKVLPELDTDFNQFWSDNLCTSELVHVIRDMIQERKDLALELSSQLRSRIFERSSTMEALKHSKIDLDTRTRRLEKEKNELQSSLERELDRRSKDWSLKVDKFQAEEQRLRERVRELAEQNVSLQREVSLYRGKEMETQSRMMNSETKLNEITVTLEEMRSDNSKLQQAISELQEQCNIAETNQDCLKRSYKEKEKETRELQKAVAKLQIICSEQEKTITGLRQGYVDHIGNSPECGDLVSKLQMEHIRLTGVEQTLRKELESFRLEVEVLRQENVYILGRLQFAGSSVSSLFRIDQELSTQLECIQSQALSLLDDGNELCSKLLKVVKGKQNEHGNVAIHESDGYSVVEYNMKLESLRRAIKNFRGKLEAVSAALHQRSNLEALECQSQKTENGSPMQCTTTYREGEMELQLKAETLLTRVLREKLFFKEQELEQLCCELGSSVRGNEILKSEIQRLQDELSCIMHKTKDMEIQMIKKDEAFNKLQHDLQECMKELTVSRGILPRVCEERDHLWEEVKRSRETNMLLDYEVKSLKKKIETLDEDILIKEGQITILKDSLGNKKPEVAFASS